MAHFFSYDNLENRHTFYGFEVKNEKGETVGYRPIIHRCPKNGGMVENISERYPQLKYKVFSTEDLARDFAIKLFKNLFSQKQ